MKCFAIRGSSMWARMGWLCISTIENCVCAAAPRLLRLLKLAKMVRLVRAFKARVLPGCQQVNPIGLLWAPTRSPGKSFKEITHQQWYGGSFVKGLQCFNTARVLSSHLPSSSKPQHVWFLEFLLPRLDLGFLESRRSKGQQLAPLLTLDSGQHIHKIGLSLCTLISHIRTLWKYEIPKCENQKIRTFG